MSVWEEIIDKNENNIKVILLIVVETIGSCAGKQGFKMLVCEDGEMFGSIGGGVSEYNYVKKAKEMFQKKDSSNFLKKQIHRADADKLNSGMICSGEQYTLLFQIDNKHIETIKLLVSALNSNKNGVLTISKEVFEFIEGEKISDQFIGIIENENNWFYKEKIGFKSSLYIIGAGHVGLAFSQTMKQLGFYVNIFDNRENLNTYISNKYADCKKILDYNNIDKLIPEDENSYIVIMTFSHQTDLLVLKKLAPLNYKYIGMLGSKKKVEKIFSILKNEGITEDELSKVYSPIGIKIGSQTPEEISISIAAEIIKVKNSRK